MLRILLIIIVTLLEAKAYSQTSAGTKDSCVNNYYIKYYSNPSISIEAGSMVFDNNSVITCGSVRVPDPSNYLDAYLMKLNADGEILWQRTIGGEGAQGLRNIKKLSDGNFVATGVDETPSSIQYFLLKFDGNGNIIWRKDFGTTNNIENFSISDISEDTDGSLIITALNIEVDPFAHFRILFAKFDKLGNIIMSRFYHAPYGADGGMMYPNSLIIKDGYAYIAGNIMIHSLKGLLMKINNSSGILEWSKVYDFNEGEANFSQVLDYANDKLCLIGVNKLNPADTSIIYLVDTSGNPSSIKYFQFSNLSNGEYGIYGTAILDNDKNLIWTMKNVSNVKWNITVSKVDPLNGVIWAKDYQQLNNRTRPRSIQLGTDNSIYTTGTKLNATDHMQIYLSKFNKDGEVACTPEDLQTSFGDGTSVVENVTFPLENKTLIQKNGSSVLVGDYLLLADSSCVFSNKCVNIKLSGPANVCKISDTIRVKVEKNNECTIIPGLEYDTSRIKMISFSGSIANFVALKPGTVSIKGRLETSCFTIEDSMKINIALPSVPIDLGRDTIICENSSLSLNAGLQFNTYQWQDGSSDPFFLAKTPGKYFVTVSDYCNNRGTDTIVVLPASNISLNLLPFYTKCVADTIHLATPPQVVNLSFEPFNDITYAGNEIKAWPSRNVNFSIKAVTNQGCLFSDSFKINVNNARPVHLQNDTAICEGEVLLLRAPAGFKSYHWSNGSNLEENRIMIAGKYWLTAIDTNGCSSSDTTNVILNLKPPVFLGNDTSICFNEMYIINPGNQFASYWWHDGTKGKTFSTDKPGTFWVKVTDPYGCTNADTLRITKYKAIPTNFLPGLDSICPLNPKSIHSRGNWSAYLWSNGMKTPSITVSKAGTYTLQVMNSEGCFGRDTIEIFEKDCIEGIWFPTAFTPNNNGVNDLFKPIVNAPLSKYYFVIYNRYGQMVFKETNPRKGWDGTVKSEMQNSGAFVWYCVYTLQGGVEEKKKGTVLLIR